MPRLRATMRGFAIATLTAALIGAGSAAQAVSPLAQDSFSRTVASGWGTADTGGGWTVSGTASRLSVDGSRGVMTTAPKVTSSAYLSGVKARDVDVAATFALSTPATGGLDYAQLVIRRAGSADYSALLVTAATGSVSVAVLNGTTRIGNAKSTGITAPVGTALRMRVQAVGASPTTIRVRAWRASDPEPTTWPLEVTDSTPALQGAGAVGVRTYRSSATTTDGSTSVDDFAASDPVATPVNTPPTASFTVSPNGLVAAVDASASADPDGAIVADSWSFGDGTSGAGATTTHTYAVAGTYAITLTVTDSGGATATTTRSVTVTGRPSQAQWLSDVTASTVGATDLIDAHAADSRPAIVLDVDNTALQTYYQPHAATPPILSIEQRALADGYAVLFATGRVKDNGANARELATAGYRATDICFRDTTVSLQASKASCRAAWAAQGYTIVANFGNHTSDLDGGNSGRQYLLPNYGFLD